MDLMTDAQITKLVLRIRHHNNIAQNASLAWQARKQYLKAYIKKNIGVYQSDAARREKVKGDWELQDHMDEWNWHRREAARLTTMLMMEMALRGDTSVVAVDPGMTERYIAALPVQEDTGNAK